MKDTPLFPEKSLVQLRKNTSLTEIAFTAIRDAIVNGRIKPGQRLMQVDLANELGVSERTVREAFARLVAKGLAVHEPYKGVRVVALPVEEIQEIYVLRILLEGQAIELAAERISDADLDLMEKLLPKTAAGDDKEAIQAAQEANREFHWIPIRASGSRILIGFLEQLWELMFTYQLLYQETSEVRSARIRNDLEQHRQFLDALKARDAEKACKLNSDHIQITIDKLIQRLEEIRTTG